jgi:hypothetical protein
VHGRRAVATYQLPEAAGLPIVSVIPASPKDEGPARWAKRWGGQALTHPPTGACIAIGRAKRNTGVPLSLV